MNVYIVSSSPDYEILWKKFGHTVVDNINDADIVQFTGGEDVSPNYYRQKKHPKTFSNPYRDVIEKALFENCFANDVPMVGICRGGQFLNVMCGGRMLQHVTNHLGDHPIEDVSTGRKILASSTHHQMMVAGPGAEIVATASMGGIKEDVDEDGNVFSFTEPVDNEVIYYQLGRCLCFQPHPEFNRAKYEPLQEYYFELINNLIFKKEVV